MATRRGDLARAALVEHAERLFAERGIEAVSLRDVSAAAGQRNHSAAQYHFGDRAGLVAAVAEMRMGAVEVHRLAHLDRLRADGRIDDLAGLVEAIVVPMATVVAETDGWYARFLARTRWDPFAWSVLGSVPTGSGFRFAMDGLRAALDPLPMSMRRHRIDQLLTLVVGTLAGWEGAPARGERRIGRDALVSDLVSTSLAVLTAPVLQGAQP